MNQKSNILFGLLFVLCLAITVSSANKTVVSKSERHLNIDRVVTENRSKVVRFSPHYTGEGASVIKKPDTIEFYIVRTGYEQFDNYCDLTSESKLPANTPN